MADFDLVVRGGNVADGTGAAIKEADIAVKGGRIAAVGKVSGRGAEEVDAKGLLVTPGGVDTHVHTHSAAVVDTATGGVLGEITVEAMATVTTVNATVSLPNDSVEIEITE